MTAVRGGPAVIVLPVMADDLEHILGVVDAALRADFEATGQQPVGPVSVAMGTAAVPVLNLIKGWT